MTTYRRSVTHNITLPADLSDEIYSRTTNNKSATFARDLDRLYTLYRHALGTVPLTLPEAQAIADTVRSRSWDDPRAAGVLAAEVADHLRRQPVAGVDVQVLTDRLADLDQLQTLALIDAAERYWAASDENKQLSQFFWLAATVGQEV